MRSHHWVSLALAVACALVAHAVPHEKTETATAPYSYSRTHVELAPISLEAQASIATSIVRVRITSLATVLANASTVTTKVGISVLEWLKGEGDSEQVIHVAGGVNGNVFHRVDAAPKFQVGEEVVLFLFRPAESDVTGILGLHLGVIRISDDVKPCHDACHGEAREPVSIESLRMVLNETSSRNGGRR